VHLALEHQEADRVPLDVGGSHQTGIHVDSVYKLRQALQLDPPGTPVKIEDPYQLLGEIAPDLLEALGADVVPLRKPATIFGYKNEGWKSWTTFGGTPVLVPEGFNTAPEPNGDILAYPGGDKTASPCARMPCGGYYFDALTRQDPIDDDNLHVEDNLEQFGLISDEDLGYLRAEAARLGATGKAVMAGFGGTGFGDIGRLPGMELTHPRGIRAIEEWYVSLSLRSDYIYEIFDRQCEIALQNLARIHAVVGDSVQVVNVTSTDFGAQQGPFISPRTYRTLFKPFHTKVNNWIHTHTKWRTFIHSCGSIWRLMDDIVGAGFECLGPVQTSAAGMGPGSLKAAYGRQLTFWGGGIDTQKVLPFGTPDVVRTMVRQRMRIFGTGGGFVFSPVHNVQAGIPTVNLLALFEAVNAYRSYPVG
jgi:hypothetical protein